MGNKHKDAIPKRGNCCSRRSKIEIGTIEFPLNYKIVILLMASKIATPCF